MNFLKKLNISKWLWISFLFYLVVFVYAFLKLNSEIFWGVFVASLLSFLTAFFIEKWLEEKEGAKTREREKEEHQRTINLIMGEIVQNESVAETISQYMRGLSGLGDQDFRGRKQDCFFLRFSTVTKESLWKQFVEGISDSKIIESTSQMYSQYEYLNHLLGAVSAFITGKLTLGSIAADYKVAVNAQPWDLQLANALVRVREQSREVASAFKDLLKA